MDSRPVKIYAILDIPRLRYIAGVILGDILGLTWEVITDKRKLGKHPAINYSNEEIAGSFKISPDPLLFETGIAARNIVVDEWKGLPVFFPTTSDSDLPFDIFAASFYLISRYEEYLEFQPDEYGRFRASSSLAFRNGFLGIPIVDMWAKEMSKVFVKRFQTLTFKRNEYEALLTIDGDQPYAYPGKSLLRSIGSLFLDMKNTRGESGSRYRILSRGEKDPFDVFDYIIEKIENTYTDARFFFSVADPSKHDKNPSWKNEEYRKLIHCIADKYRIGLHLSFYTADGSQKIVSEMGRLQSILEKEIIFCRCHYNRLFMPESYHDIHKAEIREEYSMGYPEEPGFRAGIARPYFFYDVSADKPTSLKIIPFQIMDETLYSYKNLDPVASKEVILKLINETRKVGGLFVSTWHNTSLLDTQDWKGWREVFEFMLKNQTP
jgi:hypothetical protein